jgi:O-antigen ligase
MNETPLSLVLELAGRDATLTGRTGLWTDLMTNASKSRWFGVGYGAFWVGPASYEMYPLENWSRETPRWRPMQGHNGYLDVYVELGIVGLVLLAGTLGTALFSIGRTLQNQYDAGSFRLVLFLSVLFNNVTESSLLKGTHSLWFLFLLAAVNVPALAKAPATARAVARAVAPTPRPMSARPAWQPRSARMGRS